MKGVYLADKASVVQDVAAALSQIATISKPHSVISMGLWTSRAFICLRSMFQPYAFLRSRGDKHLTLQDIKDNFALEVVERFAWDAQETWVGKVVREAGHFRGAYGEAWGAAVQPLQAFIESIPGYEKERIGRQSVLTNDQYRFIVMQLAHLCCDLQRGGKYSPASLQVSLPVIETINRILLLDSDRKGEFHDDTRYCREKLGSF